MEWLTIEPTLYFTAFTLYSELDLSLKLETKNKHNSIFVNLSSKEKKFLDHKATLFQVAISERVDFKPWYASIFIQTNHINALYYNGKNKLQLHTIPNLTIEFNHIWEYIDSLDQKIRFKLHYSKKKWFIDTNFTQFLSDKLNSWELSVNLVQIF
ncbi:MAG: hypothetical protein B6229_04160 [Spirochaetaceae bacterium 4572_7]|nr:MAG: hypothetical protein B6229_04160 [Spirochaetaceae bacterium 4572_7]